LYTRQFNEKGTEVVSEDWDNLIVLDACRFDAFREVNTLPGQLEHRESMASETVGFLKSNFAGRDLLDTVYVTANPQLYNIYDELGATFHDVIHVWQEDGWDDEYETVLPETTTTYAIDAAKRYPNKRLIVHYLQPHYPFLTDEVQFDKGHLQADGITPNLWYEKMYGRLEINADRLWDLYIDTLQTVLPSVKHLLDELFGRSVVTADHGNMFGERSFPFPIREWGHPHETFTQELIKVPWLIVEDEERHKITSEPSVSGESEVSSSVSDRLRDLGYQ
jgi:hypothetical protein